MRARNLTVATTDSVTVRTDTTVHMSIAQNLNNNGRFNISSTSGDSLTFGVSSTNSGLIQIFRGGTTPDNIVQVIYTISELQAAGMLAGDAHMRPETSAAPSRSETHGTRWHPGDCRFTATPGSAMMWPTRQP